ncbi:MAG: 4Fe-4S dicluster domain-containing protein [Candidatus Omnitrophica bacterium]|nr:4Fe-4S dicluster domain-containing protein [Candidatus Omnitrophota bacterium]MBU1869331.1 4Fe-4S dicluster domain-containing protein [Candidatus Omnitrophota bacterium]
MDTYFLKQEDLPRFYERISQNFELFVPVKVESSFKVKCEYGFSLPTEDYLLKKYPEANKEEIVFNEYRSVEPVRAFFTHFKEDICSYFKGNGGLEEKPVAICGVKNCDLFALKILDYVFLGGNEEDPAYKARRENALIVASDCTAFKEVCFCRAFEIDPFACEGFDFNLSPISNGYLLDVATKKAKLIGDSMMDMLTPASFGQLSGRSAKRDSVVSRIDEHLEYHKIPKKEALQDIVVSGFNSPVWNEQMKTCVECGGCIFICDTCHCFLLFDEKEGENAKRMRVWDGCLLKNFSTVAGGANPLKSRYMRLRNRYMKKFDFFVSNLGFQGCCGCGRCIDVCPGKIDIRYILRKLYEEKHIPSN